MPKQNKANSFFFDQHSDDKGGKSLPKMYKLYTDPLSKRRTYPEKRGENEKRLDFFLQIGKSVYHRTPEQYP